MKKRKGLKVLAEVMIVLLILIVITLLAIPDFLKFQAKAKGSGGYRQTYYPFPPANGGSAVPNGAPYDAMFFESNGVNPFIDTEDDRLSTFAVDVDTASYTLARTYIFDGNLPPKEAIRVEEFINYFRYDYPGPASGAFSINLDAAPSRFGGGEYKLLRVGLQGREIAREDRKPAVLTFVIDVSGSMDWGGRLGLVKRSLRILIDQLRPDDRIAIVVYGTNARVVLDHHGLSHRGLILEAIDSLETEGATNAEAGLRLGYHLAAQAFEPGAINRVILLSDGVANVGETGADGILESVRKYADMGIALTTVGFGMGNYNDVLMEKLADRGDGNYAYVDTLSEAERVFVENLTGTLQVIAKDVKVQVDFNPAAVSRYRLLGYENRDVADKDFTNDTVDGGEVGAGHQVTALYEIKLQKDARPGTVAKVSIRYKNPDRENAVEEIGREIQLSRFQDDFDGASADLRLAAATAEFAEILKKSYWAKDGSLDLVGLTLAELPRDYRERPEVVELMDMVNKAGRIGDQS